MEPLNRNAPLARREFLGYVGLAGATWLTPVGHLLALFHAGTGFLMQVLTAPLRAHDMAQAALLHPELDEGDILIGDRAFCSFAHLALLVGRKLQGVFRAHQKQIIDFRPHRAYNRRGRKPHRKGLPSSRWLKRLGVREEVPACPLVSR